MRVEGAFCVEGAPHKPGWLALDGPIAPDGPAALMAEGLTNLPSYALNNVSMGPPFSPRRHGAYRNVPRFWKLDHAANVHFEFQKH